MLQQKFAAVYEEEIERLNGEVARLIAKNEETLRQNLAQEEEMKRLRSALSRFSADLEQSVGLSKPAAAPVSQDAQKAHQELKRKYNDLVVKYQQTTSRLRTLESNYEAISRNKRRTSETPVQAFGDPADKARIAELERQLADAHDIIHDLEFEMDNVGHLETENEQLQAELASLRGTKELADDMGAVSLRQSDNSRESSASSYHRRSTVRLSTQNDLNESFEKKKERLEAAFAGRYTSE